MAVEIKGDWTIFKHKYSSFWSWRLPDDEKLVTIIMDEMSITQRLSYVATAMIDYFMGFPTKVGKEDNNLKQRESNALTIMVKSMKSGFKQAIVLQPQRVWIKLWMKELI